VVLHAMHVRGCRLQIPAETPVLIPEAVRVHQKLKPFPAVVILINKIILAAVPAHGRSQSRVHVIVRVVRAVPVVPALVQVLVIVVRGHMEPRRMVLVHTVLGRPAAAGTVIHIVLIPIPVRTRKM